MRRCLPSSEPGGLERERERENALQRLARGRGRKQVCDLFDCVSVVVVRRLLRLVWLDLVGRLRAPVLTFRKVKGCLHYYSIVRFASGSGTMI